ncbi:hypothetical protein TL16_g00217 [Triparma laevis f. inornata]|uniref:Fibronectin type-III domain-containing protein n=1 Tax=Triparma laevis f. inornata TaxID=1714386 RepID=A0A9W7DRI1_9STRA|nr:hypothetical protein TL16_g00217 [Triparma laevis f. inornata]
MVTVSASFYSKLSNGDKLTYSANGGTVIGGLPAGDYFAIVTCGASACGSNKIGFATTRARAFDDVNLETLTAGAVGTTHTLTMASVNALSGTGAAVIVVQTSVGVEANLYTVATGLTTGKEYFARIAAANSAGYGAYTTTDQNDGEGVVPFRHVARSQPAAPVVTATALSNSAIEVSFTEPSSEGSDIDLYKIEWTTDSDFSTLPRDIRTIRLNNTNATDVLGSFTLGYGGISTIALTAASTPAEVEAALEALETLGDVTVSAGDLRNDLYTGTGKWLDAAKNSEWDVTFVQDVGLLGDLTIDTTNLFSESTQGQINGYIKNGTTGLAYPSHYGFDYMHASKETCGSSIIGSASSVQKIVLRANDAVVTGGSFQLELDGESTDCILFSATAADLKTKLSALENVKNGVEVTSVDINAKDFGFAREYTVYFTGEYPSGEWPTLRKVEESFGKVYAANAGVGGCTAWVGGADHSLTVLPILETTACSGGVAETQAIVIDGTGILGGSFDLYFGGESIEGISVTSTALQLEAKIAGFTSITSVSVTKHAHSDQAYGTAWVVTFTANSGDIEMLQIKDLKVTGSDANANVYPMINVTTFADNADDISGDFRIYLNGETSDPISYKATQLKMVQALEKMNSVGKVAMIGSAADNVVFIGNTSMVVDDDFDSRKSVTFAGGSGETGYVMGDLTSSVALGDSISIGSCSDFATITNITYQSYPQVQAGDPFEYPWLVKNHVANFTDVAWELVDSGKLADQGVTTIHLSVPFERSCAPDGEEDGHGHPADGEGFFEAYIGKHVVSKTAVEGRVSIQSLFNVKTTYPGHADSTLRPVVYLQTGAVAGLGLSTSDKIAIDGSQYTINAINNAACGADCLTLSADYTGTAVTNADVAMPVYTETVTAYTTADLTSTLVAGSIQSIAVSAGGTGVTAAPTVTISAPTTGGVRATATANFVDYDYDFDGVNDIVLSTDIITVDATLYGHVSTGSAVVYTHGTSTTAITGLTSGNTYYVIKTSTANEIRLCGTVAKAYTNDHVDLSVVQADTDHNLAFQAVTNIHVTNAGSGYTSTPTVSFSAGTNVAASVKLITQHVWVGEDKLLVSSVTPTSVALTGVVSYDNVGARMFAKGHGVEYAVAMKAFTGDLDTLRVVPEGNWRGKNARIHVTRPNGKSPLTYVLGTPSEIQTVSLRQTSAPAAAVTGGVAFSSITTGGNNYVNPVTVTVSAPDDPSGTQATATATTDGNVINAVTITNAGTGYYKTTPIITIVPNPSDTTATGAVIAGALTNKNDFFTLTYNGAETVTMPFGASAGSVEIELEALHTVDQVTVERTGNGATAGWNYGYIYTIAFWGARPEGVVKTLTSDDSPAGSTATGGYSIHHNTVRQGVANAAYSSQYIALNENDAYAIRVTAKNAQGFGAASSVTTASTSDYGSLPTKPRSVVLGKYYTSDSLSLNYQPPLNDGGDSITKYKVEWDTSSGFDTSSIYYGSDEVAIVQEVQELSLYFRGGDTVVPRSGTFKLSWGGQTSADLAFDVGATDLEDAIAALTGVTSVAGRPIKVNKRTYGYGSKWKVTFKSGLLGNLGMMEVDDTEIVGDDAYMTVIEVTTGSADIYPGEYTYEVQTIYTSAQTAVSGSFTLSFEGMTTPSMWYDSSAAVVKDALDSLGTIHTVNVVRSQLDSALETYAWTVTFTHLKDENVQGAGDIGLLIPNKDSLAPSRTVAIDVFENVKGTNQMSYKISGVTAGESYYSRVSAYNSLGFGVVSSTSSATPRGQPNPPTSAAASIASGTSVNVAWTSVASNNGDGVDGFDIEWYSAENALEVQKLTTSSTDGIVEVQKVRTTADSDSLNGYFTLTFGGETTELLSVTEAADGEVSFESKLSKLASIGTISVTRDYSFSPLAGKTVATTTGSAIVTVTTCTSNDCSNDFSVNDIVKIGEEIFTISNANPGTNQMTLSSNFLGSPQSAGDIHTWAFGYEWTITYVSHVGDQPLIVATGADNWSGVNPTIQAYTVTNGEAPISGSFRLTYEGESTPPLIHDCTSQEVKVALESLTTVGVVGVSRFVNNNGHDYLITFTTELGPLSVINVDDSELTGPSAKAQVNTMTSGVVPTDYGSLTVASGSALSQTVTGLTQGTAYIFRVRSYNSEGYGDYVLAAPSPLSPKTAPSPVEDVGIFPMSDTAIKVVFSKPSDLGGAAITRYRVQWDMDSTFVNIATSGFQHDIVVIDPSQTQFCYNIPIPSASSTIARYVRVLAYNDYDWSSPAASTPTSVAAQLLAPGSVQNVGLSSTSATGMRVSFEPPSASVCEYGGDGGSPITSYLIEYDQNSDFNSPATSVTVDSSLTSYVIGGRDVFTGLESGGLESGSTYYVRVSAVNSVGAGPVTAATPTSVSLLDATAEAPAINSETATIVSSATSITFAWNTPTFDGGESIDYYLVEYGTDSTFGTSKFRTVDVVNEVQSIVVEADNVVIEEQAITATVAVTNERQTVRTAVTGVDEIQTITTTADEVFNEVQTVTTTAVDTNEVQTLTPYATDVNEVQVIRSHGSDVPEIQSVTVTAARVAEVQTIVFTFSNVNITTSEAADALTPSVTTDDCDVGSSCAWVESKISGTFGLSYDFDTCGELSGTSKINFCQDGYDAQGTGNTIACTPTSGAVGGTTTVGSGTNCNSGLIDITETNQAAADSLQGHLQGIKDDNTVTAFMVDAGGDGVTVTRTGNVATSGGCEWSSSDSKYKCDGVYTVTYSVTFVGDTVRGNVPEIKVASSTVAMAAQPSDPGFNSRTSGTASLDDFCSQSSTNCVLPTTTYTATANEVAVGNQPDGTIKLNYECESKTSGLTDVTTAGSANVVIKTVSDSTIDSTADGSAPGFDSTAETISITNTLYSAIDTGDRLYYSVNGGLTPIAGLTDATYYFAIKSATTDKVQLALTEKLAIAGTAIDLTGVGNGAAHILEIAPPVVGDWVRIGGSSGGCVTYGTCDEYAQVQSISSDSVASPGPYTYTAVMTGNVAKAAGTYTDVEFGHYFSDLTEGGNGVSSFCSTQRIMQTDDITVTYNDDSTANTGFKNKVEALDAIAASGVTVTRTSFDVTDSALVGFTYSITFTKAPGSVNEVACVTSSLTKTNSGAGASTCTVATVQEASLMDGEYQLSLSYPHELEAPVSNFTSGALRWNLEAANLVAALETITATHPVSSATEKVWGELAVTRTAYTPSTHSRWSGGYTWTVTFLTRGGNIPAMTKGPWSLADGTDDGYRMNDLAQPTVSAQPYLLIGDEDSSARMPDLYQGAPDHQDPSQWFVDPLSSVAKDGNQVGGSFGLTWAGTTYVTGSSSTDSAFLVQDAASYEAASAQTFLAAFGSSLCGTPTVLDAFDASDTTNVVDTTNDEITLSTNAYGKISTGDPVLYGGSAGVITGLTDATIYYVIKGTSPDVGLALTYEDAVAETAVSLTGAGTGSHTLSYYDRVSITRSTAPVNQAMGYTYTITYDHYDVGGDVAPLTNTLTNLKPSASAGLTFAEQTPGTSMQGTFQLSQCRGGPQRALQYFAFRG